MIMGSKGVDRLGSWPNHESREGYEFSLRLSFAGVPALESCPGSASVEPLCGRDLSLPEP
jgi:hypothetical protein